MGSDATGQSYPPFSWFETTDLEKENDRIANRSEELKDHIRLVHSALNTLHITLEKQPHQEKESLVILQLCARSFNTAGAALKLARSGFHQPAFAMIRDLLEVEFLADFFSRDQKHLQRWITLDSNLRKREFQPFKIRDTLDRLDGFTKQRRRAAYAQFSQYAAHADPDGFQIISPGNMTQIGPFPSEGHLAAFLQETAKHLPAVCIPLLKLLDPLQADVLIAQRIFNAELSKWRAKYSPKPLS